VRNDAEFPALIIISYCCVIDDATAVRFAYAYIWYYVMENATTVRLVMPASCTVYQMGVLTSVRSVPLLERGRLCCCSYITSAVYLSCAAVCFHVTLCTCDHFHPSSSKRNLLKISGFYGRVAYLERREERMADSYSLVSECGVSEKKMVRKPPEAMAC